MSALWFFIRGGRVRLIYDLSQVRMEIGEGLGWVTSWAGEEECPGSQLLGKCTRRHLPPFPLQLSCCRKECSLLGYYIKMGVSPLCWPPLNRWSERLEVSASSGVLWSCQALQLLWLRSLVSRKGKLLMCFWAMSKLMNCSSRSTQLFWVAIVTCPIPPSIALGAWASNSVFEMLFRGWTKSLKAGCRNANQYLEKDSKILPLFLGTYHSV